MIIALRQVNSIQYLRGLAAGIIVLRHLTFRTEKYNIFAPGLNGLEIGNWGVDLFFVISGFVMMHITKVKHVDYLYILNFWLRRYLRISPMYYIMTLCTILAALYNHSYTESAISIENTINSLLYIPSYNISPILGVGWSLNYEMYFYFIFGLLLLLPEKLQIMAMLCWLVISIGFGLIYPGDNPIIKQVTNPILIEFSLGVFIAKFLQAKNVWTKHQAYWVLFFSFTTILLAEIFGVDNQYRFFWYGFPCASLVSGLIALEARGAVKFQAKLLLLAGDISYSLYLSHILVIAMFGKLVMKYSLFNFINGYLLFFLDFICCLVMAYFIFKLVEKPLHIFTHKVALNNTI